MAEARVQHARERPAAILAPSQYLRPTRRRIRRRVTFEHPAEHLIETLGIAGLVRQEPGGDTHRLEPSGRDEVFEL